MVASASMAERDDLIDQRLPAILAPGERPLYRTCAGWMPRGFWKRFLRVETPSYLVVTNRRLFIFRLKYGWFGPYTIESVDPPIPLEHIAHASAWGLMRKWMFTFRYHGGGYDTFDITVEPRNEAQRAFLHQLPVILNTKQLPCE